MEGIVKKLLNHEDSKKNDSTHTLMNGGKFYIPEEQLDKFYREFSKHTFQSEKPLALVERIKGIHPLLFDIDLKYKGKLNGRAFGEDVIEELIALFWAKVQEAFEISDPINQCQAWVMMKETPYPCILSDFESKDGIHIVFPNIIMKRDEYKDMMKDLQESQEVEDIFAGCEISPDNKPKTMVDADFASWMIYGSGKPGEQPYAITNVYQLTQDGTISQISSERFDAYYSSNPENNYTIARRMSVAYRKEEEINAKIIPEYLESLQEKGFKPSSSKNSSGKKKKKMSEAPVINPYDIIEADDDKRMEFRIEGEELGLVKSFVGCLSKERSDEYSGWIDVGMALHNINEDLLETWITFSKLSGDYEDGVCESKWKSFSQPSGSKRLGYPSLRYWAKQDDLHKFVECLYNSLRGTVESAASEGPDADFLIAKVAYEYLKTDYLCIDANDDWMRYNGTTWERDMKGSDLRLRIHKEVYALFHRYYNIFQNEMDKANKEKEGWFEKMRDNCHIIKKKLYKGTYVRTIMEHLRYLFYKKDIMELFDSKNHLLAFENGVYDLNEKHFRLGKPEDYLTISTKIKLPVDAKDLPLKIDKLEAKVIENTPAYDILNRDLQDFLKKIIPIDEVRAYTIRFLSKCLSGDNRDEGFYIWTGTGGNGKSKLIDLMGKCLGEYYCNLPVALLTQKRKASGAASPEMAITKGKRLAVMQEPDVNETLNVGEMKEITGNDTIQARGLYKEPFEFVPQFKLLMMCNDLPNIPSNDDGTWRRLEAVQFISRFVSKDVNEEKHRYLIDKSLKEKLPLWKVPMMLLLLREWASYDEHGIVVPDGVKQTTRDYRNKNDIVGRWIDLKCEPADYETEPGVSPEDSIVETAPTCLDDLYTGFKNWFEGEGYNAKAMTKSTFKSELENWQRKSKWDYVETKDGSLNGTKRKPRFNLIIVDDDL